MLKSFNCWSTLAWSSESIVGASWRGWMGARERIVGDGLCTPTGNDREGGWKVRLRVFPAVGDVGEEGEQEGDPHQVYERCSMAQAVQRLSYRRRWTRLGGGVTRHGCDGRGQYTKVNQTRVQSICFGYTARDPAFIAI